MKKLILLLSCSLLISFYMVSQDNNSKKGFDPSKIVVDGNVGVNVDNNSLNISLIPLFSYPILPNWYVGLGPNISYVQNLNTTQSTFNYGVNVFTRYYFIPELYAQAESEWLNYQSGSASDGTPVRSWTNSLMLGAGYNQSLGNGINASFTVLYIVNYKSGSSPYSNPLVFRGGINKSF